MTWAAMASHDMTSHESVHEKTLDQDPEDYISPAFASRYLSEPIVINKWGPVPDLACVDVRHARSGW